MALLSMRARKFYQRTGRKIIIDGSSTAGYDKSKNQGGSSKAVRIEDASEKAMCAIDGAGFDWSDMAEEEIQANMALMAFSDSEVTNDKSCLKNYEALKKQYDDLLVKLDDTDFKASTYKRGLSILEGQIIKYKESEVLFSEEIALLKRNVGHKEYLMGLLKTELEKMRQQHKREQYQSLNDKGFVDMDSSMHMSRNNSPDAFRFKTLIGVMLLLAGVQIEQISCGKGADEKSILHKIPRQDNMYSFDMKNIVPKDGLTCLVAKATSEESMLWHRRLGHVNFKNINKLVKENLVRDLLLKRFKEMTKLVVAVLKATTTEPLDETSEILQNFIKEIENLVDKKVKIIRSDNGTEFKNKVVDELCRKKGIKREYSVARTPQQNGVAERKNRTLIEAAKTMLADSKLPTTFWAEAVSTACYVQNRSLIALAHNKTPMNSLEYSTSYSFMKPFGCHVTILNTLDKLGKFDRKSDEGFFVGYSIRYHTLKMKPKTVAQAIRNMIKYLKNQGYNKIMTSEPMEHGTERRSLPEKIKSPEKN
ncbi:putative ribonuclease H-like domain-containing protein [Tanacetum coccineum]